MSDTHADEATTSDEVDALDVEPITPEPHSLGLELPDDPDETIRLLLREIATTRDEAGTYLNDLKRVAADFENYRKRSIREHAEMLNRATEKVVTGLMPVLDTFERRPRRRTGVRLRTSAVLGVDQYTRTASEVSRGRRARGCPDDRRGIRPWNP